MLSLIEKAVPFAMVGAAVIIADFVKLGTVVAAILGLAVAAFVAFFTIRNLQRSYWRNLVDERDAEIIELKQLAEEHLQERANFAEEQRDLRHRLKGEIADLRNQLELELAKSDLTSVFSRIDNLEKTLRAREPIFEEIVSGIHKQSEVLGEILAELRGRPEGS